MKRLLPMLLALTLIGALLVPAAAADDQPIGPDLHSVGEALLLYVPNRVNDVFDIAHASVGFGLGYGLNARATSQIQMTIEDHSDLRFGWHENGVLPTVWDDTTLTGGATLGPFACGDTTHDPCEVGAGLHAGIVGADVAADLYEVADAALGIFLVDISEDDEGPTLHSRPEW